MVSAALWVPARLRLAPVAVRLIHGERGPPDGALRTFEARLAQALPLEELLLGSPRPSARTLDLQVAEVWIATGPTGARRLRPCRRQPAWS